MSRPARLLVYLEDPPLRSDLNGRGLARVNTALLQALGPDFLRAVVLPMHSSHGHADCDPRFADRIAVMPRPVTNAIKAGHKWGGRIGAWMAHGLLGAVSWRWRALQADWVFAPIGTDVRTAEHALRLARATGARCALYLVDDLEAADAIAGGTEAAEAALAARLGKALRRADRVFAITHALGDVLARRHGVACHPLPLPFAPRPSKAVDLPRQPSVVHIGAVNHIYASGLLTTARALATLRARGHDVNLRLTTSPTPALLGQLAGLVPVDCTPFEGEGALESFLAGALCAVVPVEAESSGMYATSSPSKLLEYMNACRSIVALGPPEAEAVRFMREHDLPHIAGDEAALVDVLTRLIEQPEDHGAAYQRALATVHHPDVIRATILDGLAR